MNEYVGCGTSFKLACINLELFLRACKNDAFRVGEREIMVKNPRYKDYKRELKRKQYTPLTVQPKKIGKKVTCAYLPDKNQAFIVDHLKNGQNGLHIARIFV